jgi:hypothetical protein
LHTINYGHGKQNKHHEKDQIETWLSEIKDPILVCGSFGRSGVSRTFKQSFVTQVTGSHRLPVFITHR